MQKSAVNATLSAKYERAQPHFRWHGALGGQMAIIMTAEHERVQPPSELF